MYEPRDMVPLRRLHVALVVLATGVLAVAWSLRSSSWLASLHGIFPTWMHVFAECLAVVVSAMVFVVGWHAYDKERPASYVLLACGFLAVAVFDFMHMLSYAGMPELVSPASPQKAISFWLAARLTCAAVLLLAAALPPEPLRDGRSRYATLAAMLALTLAVCTWLLGFPDTLPRFFVEGSGVTPAKIAVEWVAVLLTAAAAFLIMRRSARAHHDRQGLVTACAFLVLSSLTLLLYVTVNDVFSLLGHVFKVIGFLLIYRAVFVASVREPYERLAAEMDARQRVERQAEILEFFDTLTGLPNRALLQDRATQALAEARREHSMVALMLINIDRFRAINDSNGHAAGDSLLREVGARLAEAVRDTDSVYRLGADEFAVLLKDMHDPSAAVFVQAKVAEQLGQPMSLPGSTISVTASTGIAIAPRDADVFEMLLQHADTALGNAKRAGGGSWRFFDASMNREAVDRLELRSGLRRALEDGGFALHYQPQIVLATREVIGVEALLRWSDPRQGVISPARFIPEAEETGLIVPIGEWVMHEVCRQIVAWRRAGLHVPRVAVNLSAVQFQRSDVALLVEKALESHGLAPDCLELELTESTLVHDPEAVMATMRRLRGNGFRLALDDFGTGYCSLAYLRSFPLDTLKIDQGFVRRIAGSPDDEAIVRTIVALARDLRLETVAEGVEDDETAALLARMGCDLAQGYLFGRPMPGADVMGFFRPAEGLVAKAGSAALL